MACAGAAPTISVCDASITDCAVALTATVDVPCGSADYYIVVYYKKDSAPSGLPGEQIFAQFLGSGPATVNFSDTHDITGLGCGDFHYLFRVECLSPASTHGTCTDMVSKSDNVNVDTFEATLDSEH